MSAVTIDREAVARFWLDYCRTTGASGAPPHAFWFGDGPALADELAALVVAGPKRATAGLLEDAGKPGEVMPFAGMLSIVVDGQGQPRCVIRTTEVRVGPMSSVDARFAWDEGEGDRSLAWWRRAHHAYFTGHLARQGRAFDDGIDTIFERFAVIWPPECADPA